eukprot:2015572-Rhodomonas_salina.1
MAAADSEHIGQTASPIVKLLCQLPSILSAIDGTWPDRKQVCPVSLPLTWHGRVRDRAKTRWLRSASREVFAVCEKTDITRVGLASSGCA